MGAPVNNKNAAKPKLFAEALKRELAQRDLKDGAETGETLRKIASKWVEKALEGDAMLGKEIRDTLDGKPAQAVAVTGEDGGPVETISRIELVALSANSAS